MEKYYATNLIKSTNMIIKTLHTTCLLYTYMIERPLYNFTLVKKYYIFQAEKNAENLQDHEWSKISLLCLLKIVQAFFGNQRKIMMSQIL